MEPLPLPQPRNVTVAEDAMLRRASALAQRPVASAALPPLPRPFRNDWVDVGDDTHAIDTFTADQMRGYAMAAVLAERERSADIADDHAFTAEIYKSAADAKTGEPAYKEECLSACVAVSRSIARDIRKGD